jgi:hypothetical protein
MEAVAADEDAGMKEDRKRLEYMSCDGVSIATTTSRKRRKTHCFCLSSLLSSLFSFFSSLFSLLSSFVRWLLPDRSILLLARVDW